jgi:hypothetical protein
MPDQPAKKVLLTGPPGCGTATGTTSGRHEQEGEAVRELYREPWSSSRAPGERRSSRGTGAALCGKVSGIALVSLDGPLALPEGTKERKRKPRIRSSARERSATFALRRPRPRGSEVKGQAQDALFSLLIGERHTSRNVIFVPDVELPKSAAGRCVVTSSSTPLPTPLADGCEGKNGHETPQEAVRRQVEFDAVRDRAA